MNPSIKKKWLEALRSGKYKQGRGFLERDGKYCCLGVLGLVVLGSRATVVIQDILGETLKEVRSSGRQLLNDSTLQTCGLSHSKQLTLAELNDKPKSFKEIADYIEQDFD